MDDGPAVPFSQVVIGIGRRVLPRHPRGTGASHPDDALVSEKILMSAVRRFAPQRLSERSLTKHFHDKNQHVMTTTNCHPRCAPVRPLLRKCPNLSEDRVRKTAISDAVRTRSNGRSWAGGTLIRHSQVRFLSAQPHRLVVLARRETLRKSPDIPCVSSYRLRLWRLLIPVFGPKSASFVGLSQFDIFQFPFLHPEVDQRLVCH
jgi:hypothetical protein